MSPATSLRASNRCWLQPAWRLTSLPRRRHGGVAKPDPAFFVRLISEACVPAESILYVGDRVDNDVLPARATGMRTVFVRRGPWGYLHALKDEASLADLRVDSLQELTAWLNTRWGA
ncbi:HAD family hydrolase [Mycobacterium sp. NPDC051198]